MIQHARSNAQATRKRTRFLNSSNSLHNVNSSFARLVNPRWVDIWWSVYVMKLNDIRSVFWPTRSMNKAKPAFTGRTATLNWATDISVLAKKTPSTRRGARAYGRAFRERLQLDDSCAPTSSTTKVATTSPPPHLDSSGQAHPPAPSRPGASPTHPTHYLPQESPTVPCFAPPSPPSPDR